MPSKNQISYAELVRLLHQDGRQREGEAFEYLKSASKKLIYHIVLGKGGSQMEAETVFVETVEDVFQKVLKNDYHPEKSNLSTFIAGVANKKWLNVSRGKRNRQNTENKFLELNRDNIEKPVHAGEFDDEQLQQIIKALVDLDESCFTILNEYYLKGRKLKDIAKELNISESAAKKRRQRCIEKLKKKFGF